MQNGLILLFEKIDSKLKQNANKGCNSCATARLVLCFIASFILLVIAPLTVCPPHGAHTG